MVSNSPWWSGLRAHSWSAVLSNRLPVVGSWGCDPHLAPSMGKMTGSLVCIWKLLSRGRRPGAVSLWTAIPRKMISYLDRDSWQSPTEEIGTVPKRSHPLCGQWGECPSSSVFPTRPLECGRRPEAEPLRDKALLCFADYLRIRTKNLFSDYWINRFL